jgi:N-methylhydantoinase A
LGTDRERGRTEAKAHREVYFDEEYRDVPVYERSRLSANAQFEGPAIVEQTDTTVVVEPSMTASIDAFDNLILEMEEK